MAVPGFHEMFVLFLRFLADGKPHRMREVAEHAENHFKLSPANREELIPNGQSSKLATFVSAACIGKMP
jgi:restriction endonuclease Mrr